VRRNPNGTALCAALRKIIDGDRSPGLPSALPDPVDRAVVCLVLEHIAQGG
jgi:hypothetical protein